MEAYTALVRPGSSRWQRIKGSLDSGQWRSVFGMAAVIVGLHVVGFVLLFAFVAPNAYGLGASGAFTVGVGITAYTLGLRHAFDADHISAIDNTTRKLMNEGQKPLSVGFFFSLGHSTIVFALAFLFAIGIRALSGQVENDGSTLQSATGWIGTSVSGHLPLRHRRPQHRHPRRRPARPRRDAARRPTTSGSLNGSSTTAA